MQTQQLLNTAHAHVQQIAQQYKPRAAFAYKQQLSDAVVCKSVYTDDVDVCFVFTLHNSSITVDVYCNYNCTYCTGYVYGTENVQLATQVLAQHFNLQVSETVVGEGSVYFATA